MHVEKENDRSSDSVAIFAFEMKRYKFAVLGEGELPLSVHSDHEVHLKEETF